MFRLRMKLHILQDLLCIHIAVPPNTQIPSSASNIYLPVSHKLASFAGFPKTLRFITDIHCQREESFFSPHSSGHHW